MRIPIEASLKPSRFSHAQCVKIISRAGFSPLKAARTKSNLEYESSKAADLCICQSAKHGRDVRGVPEARLRVHKLRSGTALRAGGGGGLAKKKGSAKGEPGEVYFIPSTNAYKLSEQGGSLIFYVHHSQHR